MKASSKQEGKIMNKAEMVKYMKDELADMRKSLDETTREYAASDHDDKLGMSIRLDKLQDIYYHFWMVCNDLGLTDKNS